MEYVIEVGDGRWEGEMGVVGGKWLGVLKGWSGVDVFCLKSDREPEEAHVALRSSQRSQRDQPAPRQTGRGPPGTFLVT